MTLIYTGAFDELICPGRPGVLKDYEIAIAELLKAAKSKASLPKKKKGEQIGMVDIKSDLQLSLWRHDANPVAEVSIIDHFKGALASRGFDFLENNKNFPFLKKNKHQPESMITPNWDIIFDIEVQARAKYKYEKPVKIGISGVVSEQRISVFQGNKKRIIFKLFTGMCETGEIIIWPEKNKKEPTKANIEATKPGSIGIAFVESSLYRGKKGAVCEEFVGLTL